MAEPGPLALHSLPLPIHLYVLFHRLCVYPRRRHAIYGGDSSFSNWFGNFEVALLFCQRCFTVVYPDRAVPADLRGQRRNIRKLLIKFHPDKYAQSGWAPDDYRTQYAAACLYTILRATKEWLEAIDNGTPVATALRSVGDPLAMPPFIHTPFTLDDDECIPSQFEFVALKHYWQSRNANVNVEVASLVSRRRTLIESQFESSYYTRLGREQYKDPSSFFGSFRGYQETPSRPVKYEFMLRRVNPSLSPYPDGVFLTDAAPACPFEPVEPTPESCLPPPRDKATPTQVAQDPFAVVDHLSFPQCAGFAGYGFSAIEKIQAKHSDAWLSAYGQVLEAVNFAACPPRDAPTQPLRLERRIKMFFLIPTLLLRIPPKHGPGGGQTSVRTPLGPVLTARLTKWKNGNWGQLIDDFVADCLLVAIQNESAPPSRRSGDPKHELRRMHDVLDDLSSNRAGRARKTIISLGTSDPSQEHIKAQLAAKHPKRKEPIPPMEPEQAAWDRIQVTNAEVRKALLEAETKSKAGLGCIQFSHLKCMLRAAESETAGHWAKNCLDLLTTFGNHVLKVDFPQYFYAIWVAGRGIATNKTDAPPESVDVRPILCGYAVRRIISKAARYIYAPSLASILVPQQTGVNVPAGSSQLYYKITAMQDIDPSFVIIKLDMKNAFNEVKRAHTLREIASHVETQPLFAYNHATMTHKSYVAYGSGSRLVEPGFLSEEGMQQGEIDGGDKYNLSVDPAYKHGDMTLKQAHPNAGLGASFDDCYLAAPPEEAFDRVEAIKQALTPIGLELRPDKSECYIPDEYRTEAFHRFRGEIPESGITLPSGERVRGIHIQGIPHGDPRYIKASLDKIATERISQFHSCRDFFDQDRLDMPMLPLKQGLHFLILRSLQHTGNYWPRHIRPELCQDFAEKLDTALDRLVEGAFGCRLSAMTELARLRLRLPTSKKGGGLRSLKDRLPAEYLGGLHQAVLPLLTPTTIQSPVGGGVVTLPPAHRTPGMLRLLGANSFLHDNDTPWQHILQHHPNSLIARGIKSSWSSLTNIYRSSDLTPEQDSLLAQDIATAGSIRGQEPPKSVTRALAKEYEKAQFAAVEAKARLLPWKSQEAQAFRNADRYSSSFLTSPPDAIGYLSDTVFQECVAVYYGQPSPVCSRFAGQYIGNEGDVRLVDEFGNTVAAHNKLPGGGHIRCHDESKFLLAQILKAAGCAAEVEPRDIFHGQVPQDAFEQYSMNTSCDAYGRSRDRITPDILVHDFPVSRTINDGHGPRTAKAIFDIKCIRIGSDPGVNYPKSKRGVEKKAEKTRSEYIAKARKCDADFAPDHDGCFEKATRGFVSGGVIACVFGTFGEMSDSVDKVLRIAAKAMVKKGQLSNFVPVADASSFRSAVQLQLHQLRRAIAINSARANVELKLRRLHLIRQTREDAARAARAYGSNPSSSGPFSDSRVPHWFAGREDDLFKQWNMFRNHHHQQDFHATGNPSFG